MEFKKNIPKLEIIDNKRTSKEWLALTPKEWGLQILDPDGWDRMNYEYSFNQELITKDVFMNRVIGSTIQANVRNMVEYEF